MDASIKGWKAFFQNQKTGVPWSKLEAKEHMNWN